MRRHSISQALMAAIVGISITACNPSDIVDGQATEIPRLNPNAVKSKDGAASFYRGVIWQQSRAIAQYVRVSGLLTDELQSSSGTSIVDPNQRIFFAAETDNLFSLLHYVRANARQGRGAIREYLPTDSAALVSHLYSIEGYATLLLGELYCSGVPLSTIEYSGNYTLAKGSTTSEILRTAIALFDSALRNEHDSVHFSSLARVGKARALLGLTLYDSAADVVAAVPDSFEYAAKYLVNSGVTISNGFERSTTTGRYSRVFAMSDLEGQTGLPYVRSKDPRTDTAAGVNLDVLPFPWYVAKKYSDMAGSSPIVLATGIEARLIEAEAALHNDDIPRYLQLINRLRTTCAIDAVCSNPAPAGTGKVAGLRPLPDPASQPKPPGVSDFDARLNLLFDERAYWMFLTGHRQGDMRRLIRNYHREQETVYPTGPMPAKTNYGSEYGSEIVLPIPTGELDQNPLAKGCNDLNA